MAIPNLTEQSLFTTVHLACSWRCSPPDSYNYSRFQDRIQVVKIHKFSANFLVGLYKCEIPFATTGGEGLKKEPKRALFDLVLWRCGCGFFFVDQGDVDGNRAVLVVLPQNEAIQLVLGLEGGGGNPDTFYKGKLETAQGFVADFLGNGTDGLRLF